MSSQPTPARNRDPFARFRLDHVRVLAQAAELERRVLTQQGAPDDPTVHDTVALLERQFATHMASEDCVLYPLVDDAFPAGRATLESLRADHAELRLMLATALAKLGQPSSAARDEQLRVVLRDLVDLLRLHIHREESAVFDVATRVLTESEADALARLIAPLIDVNPSRGSEPGPAKGRHP